MAHGRGKRRPAAGLGSLGELPRTGQLSAARANYTLNVDGQRVKQKGYITTELTDYAIEWLKEQKPAEKPFCLISRTRPCMPTSRPEPQDDGSLKDLTYPRPATEAGTPENLERPRWLRDQRNSWHGVDFPYHSALDIAGYYKRYCETLPAPLDDSIARVLQQLKDMGIHDETLVIYMGDNGFMFGEHGLIDKRTAYEASMRVPMSADAPRSSRAAPRSAHLRQHRRRADHPGGDGAQDAGVYGTGEFPAAGRGRGLPWRDRFLYVYYWEKNFRRPRPPSRSAATATSTSRITGSGTWMNFTTFRAIPMRAAT